MKKLGLIVILLVLLCWGCTGPEVEPTVPTPTETAQPSPVPSLPPPAETLPPPAELPVLEDGTELTPEENHEFTVGATDSDNQTLVFFARNLPPGATFDPETRTFSWTPEVGQAGVYPGVTFYVTDGELWDSESIRITVYSINRPPVLEAIPIQVVDVGSLVEITLQASDPDGDELTFSAQNLPPGAQFTPPVFSWTPAEAGVWPAILFTVTDGNFTKDHGRHKDSQKVIIVVR